MPGRAGGGRSPLALQPYNGQPHRGGAGVEPLVERHQLIHRVVLVGGRGPGVAAPPPSPRLACPPLASFCNPFACTSSPTHLCQAFPCDNSADHIPIRTVARTRLIGSVSWQEAGEWGLAQGEETQKAAHPHPMPEREWPSRAPG